MGRRARPLSKGDRVQSIKFSPQESDMKRGDCIMVDYMEKGELYPAIYMGADLKRRKNYVSVAYNDKPNKKLGTHKQTVGISFPGTITNVNNSDGTVTVLFDDDVEQAGINPCLIVNILGTEEESDEGQEGTGKSSDSCPVAKQFNHGDRVECEYNDERRPATYRRESKTAGYHVVDNVFTENGVVESKIKLPAERVRRWIAKISVAKQFNHGDRVECEYNGEWRPATYRRESKTAGYHVVDNVFTEYGVVESKIKLPAERVRRWIAKKEEETKVSAESLPPACEKFNRKYYGHPISDTCRRSGDPLQVCRTSDSYHWWGKCEVKVCSCKRGGGIMKFGKINLGFD